MRENERTEREKGFAELNFFLRTFDNKGRANLEQEMIIAGQKKRVTGT